MSASGFLINFDEARRSDLIMERAASGFSEFSDALSISDWLLPELSIALISFDGTSIDFISLARKGNKVATSKKKFQFFDIITLNVVELSSIEKSIDTKLARHFINSSSGHGNLIPPATFKEVISAIKSLRPNQATEIDRLLSLQKVSRYKIKPDNLDIFQQEREAIGAALDVFSGSNKLRTKILSQWAPPESMLKFDDRSMEATLQNDSQVYPSFFDGLSKDHFLEEDALQHDLMNFDGIFGNHKYGITKFELGNRKLEVIYANRNDLERALGVDLIYFNPNQSLFVLVQYKMLHGIGENALYRPDSQFEIELQRMDAFAKQYPDRSELRMHSDYRLLNDGFMFKFVHSSGFQPGTGDLIDGMYITREYMKFLLSEYVSKGQRGGTIISEKSAPRHITNTEFAKFVNRGWIGTRNGNTSLLHDIITQNLQHGRKIVFAKEDYTDDFLCDQSIKEMKEQEKRENLKQQH